MSKAKKSEVPAQNTRFIDELNSEFEGDSIGALSGDSPSNRADTRESFAEMLGASLKSAEKKLKVGDKVRGKILVLGQEDVFVSTGTRHDGIVSRRALLDGEGKCPYKTDDVIDLYVIQVRGDEVRLSPHPTDKNVAEDLEDAFDMMLPVQGRVVEVCKGGVRVNLKGKLAFCPISQIDVKRVETPDEYVGRTFEFKITQFDEGGRNIVVSRRKVLEEERELGMGAFLEATADGDVKQGTVVRLEKFGAFIELSPGVDGLVHISEIAWSRIGDPSEVLQVGQTVTVKVLKRETVGDRVKLSLSIKQVTPKDVAPLAPSGAAPAFGNAGSGAEPLSKYSPGQTVTGKVSRKEIYGLFVQLEPGITGLLHKSKIIDSPDVQFERVKVGDEITVQIGEITAGERKISLDLPRDPNADDWRKHMQSEEAASKSSAGSMGSMGGLFSSKLSAALAKKKS